VTDVPLGPLLGEKLSVHVGAAAQLVPAAARQSLSAVDPLKQPPGGAGEVGQVAPCAHVVGLSHQ